jgi:hypothetical protein
MPGPAPKHPSTRARTNKTSTAATLRADPKVKAPALPDRVWHPMTQAWWADVWSSPMAPEFDDSDRHGLFALAMLVDDFWNADSSRERRDLAAEIRQQGQRFGLSPIDRRRLQWEIERADDAQDRGQRRRSARQPAKSDQQARDPRDVLRLA